MQLIMKAKLKLKKQEAILYHTGRCSCSFCICCGCGSHLVEYILLGGIRYIENLRSNLQDNAIKIF